MTSIAVVVLDTLRKDAFDRHFDWLPGRRYERAYSTANWTVPAHASLFTGSYSSEVGVHAKHRRFDCEVPALAERLRDAGYVTRAFSANTNVTSHFEFDRGFDDFRVPELLQRMEDEHVFDWLAFNRQTPRTGLARYLAGVYACVTGDAATLPSLAVGVRLALEDGLGVRFGGTREAIDLVEETSVGDREFLFLNLMEAHEPFVAPEEYATVEEPPLTDAVGDRPMRPVDGEHVRQAYDDCVRYLSAVYGDLFDRLRAEFDYVVTLSDHGEMLGERGAWGHEHGLYPELTHVPLVVSGEGFDDEPPSHAPVTLLDVHETVLDLAGLTADGRGSSLAEVGDGREWLTEYHGLTVWSERKLQRNGYDDDVDRYDAPLRGYVGPDGCYAHETPDGIESTGCADGVEPRARIEDLARDLDVRRVERDRTVPASIEARLEHLGYA